MNENTSAPSDSTTFPVKRACELQTTPLVDRWLISSLWAAEGVGVIGGTPKSCKSWLGLEIAVSVATGTRCLKRFSVPNPGPALIYLAEDAQHVLKDRLIALCSFRNISLEDLDVLVMTQAQLRLDVLAHQQRLDCTIATIKPRLLLLDPFVRLHRIDENNAQEVAAILAWLRTIQRRYNTAIIMVHHARKSGSRTQQGQALRGSGDLHAWGDSNLYLAHEKDSLRLTIEHRAAPAPDPLFLSLTRDPLHLALCDSPALSAPSLDERIVSQISQAQQPLRRTELRQRLAVNNSRLGQALASLEQLGRIRRSQDGWHL